MNTKNLPLIVGIALPILFILIISALVFLPSLSIKPQYNFLYTNQDDYYSYGQGYKNTYKVENGKIALEPLPVPPKGELISYKSDSPKIYFYDFKNNSSHEITWKDALKLNLDPGPSSPDGYNVSYYYGNDGIFELFGSGNNSRGYFVSKGSAKKKLSGLLADNYSYQGNFKFIGWVK
jgi:hypothetical protein